MQDIFSSSVYITGTEVNYYFICKTKLWLFSHNIQMEKENENVRLGKQIHKKSFKRDEKDVRLGPVAFDFVRRKDKLELHETKKSSSMEESHRFQVLYYLKFLKDKGIDAEAVIHFPKERKKKELELTDEDEEELEKVLEKISKIKDLESMPEPKKKKICRKCAYFEFCFA